MADLYQPRPEDRFTFGLWTIGNIGRDPFGGPVRSPLDPVELLHLLEGTGVYGVNLHDNDLVPIDATPSERDEIVAEFKRALKEAGLFVPMVAANLFTDPVFKDGAFTANDPRVRLYALQKSVKSIDLAVELGATLQVIWGGREGVETDVSRSPLEALKRLREAINFLCEYVLDQKYDLRFALEAKPNEPRGDLYLPTTGAMLGFITTLDHPEMVGVNPEMAHEHMAGLNFTHAVAQAWDAGKLFHIDLNDQAFGRYDQDLRFGSHSLKQTFFLVKFLEDVGYKGSRHFDAHAYRTEDYGGVRDFVMGCMRNYLILREKARQFNEDKEIQALMQAVSTEYLGMDLSIAGYSREKLERLNNFPVDRTELSQGLQYERLDQMLVELLLGVRR